MRKRYPLDFTVTVCLGGGDGGDVRARVAVDFNEFEMLKDCYRQGEEIDAYDGLEDLVERVTDEARGEWESCAGDSGEENDFDSVTYLIEMPDEVIDEVECEDSEEEEDTDGDEE